MAGTAGRLLSGVWAPMGLREAWARAGLLGFFLVSGASQGQSPGCGLWRAAGRVHLPHAALRDPPVAMARGG